MCVCEKEREREKECVCFTMVQHSSGGLSCLHQPYSPLFGRSQDAAVVMSSSFHAVKHCFVLLFTLRWWRERGRGIRREEAGTGVVEGVRLIFIQAHALVAP